MDNLEQEWNRCMLTGLVHALYRSGMLNCICFASSNKRRLYAEYRRRSCLYIHKEAVFCPHSPYFPISYLSAIIKSSGYQYTGGTRL